MAEFQLQEIKEFLESQDFNFHWSDGISRRYDYDNDGWWKLSLNYPRSREDKELYAICLKRFLIDELGKNWAYIYANIPSPDIQKAVAYLKSLESD